MNTYEVRFDGHWLGGIAIVAARNEAQALFIVKQILPEHGLPNDKPVIAKTLDANTEGILYIDSGDY